MDNQRPAARSLRSAERYLISPSLPATLGSDAVEVCDLSTGGARLRHDVPLGPGSKCLLRLHVPRLGTSLALETLLVWTHHTVGQSKFTSGVRILGDRVEIESLLAALAGAGMAHRVEELRCSDRYVMKTELPARFAGVHARLEELSANGARVVLTFEAPAGLQGKLDFSLPAIALDCAVPAEVAWSRSQGKGQWRTGLKITDRNSMVRLAIAHLCDSRDAEVDAHSLELKLRVMRARARDLASECHRHECCGAEAEQCLLVQAAREELRDNTEEALYWDRRARMALHDGHAAQAIAPIAHQPEAIAVWEYLGRSIDPALVKQIFAAISS